MTPAGFSESNFVMHPPADMSPDQCEPLQVWKGDLTEGGPCVISCYKLTQDEIDHLLKGGRLWLYVIGEGMPPVALSTKHPWRNA